MTTVAHARPLSTGDTRSRAYAALAGAGILWGTGFAFGKWAFNELSVEHTIFYRFLFGTLGLLPILWREEGRSAIRACLAEFPTFTAAAIVGVPVQFIVQYAGLERTTVSHASLMIGVLPVLLAAAAVMFARERLGGVAWLALLASTLGAALIAVNAGRSSEAHGPTVAGDLLVVASMGAAVAWVLLSKRLMHARGGQSPAGVTVAVIFAGTLVLAPWVVVHSGLPPVHLSRDTWIAVIAQGLLCTTGATLLWNWGLSRVPASFAGIFVNLEPLTGAILGIALFHEVLGWTALAGGALVIAATVVVSVGDSGHDRTHSDTFSFEAEGPDAGTHRS